MKGPPFASRRGVCLPCHRRLVTSGVPGRVPDHSEREGGRGATRIEQEIERQLVGAGETGRPGSVVSVEPRRPDYLRLLRQAPAIAEVSYRCNDSAVTARDRGAGDEPLHGRTRRDWPGKSVQVFAIERLGGQAAGAATQTVGTPAEPAANDGPLTERQEEVVALIVRGCTKRAITEQLVIAEGAATTWPTS